MFGSRSVLYFGHLSEGREQVDANCGNTLLVNKGHTIVQGLTANDAILLAVNDKATEARRLLILFVPLRQEVIGVDVYDAGNIFFALKSLDFCEHFLLVLFDCRLDDALDDCLVALADTESHGGLDELDQALDEEVLEQGFVVFWLSFQFGCHLNFSLELQGLNELVCFPHLVDARLIQLGTPFDLHVHLSDVDVFLELVCQPLTFSLDHLLFADSEVMLRLLLDLSNSFISVRFDEVNHGS